MTTDYRKDIMATRNKDGEPANAHQKNQCSYETLSPHDKNLSLVIWTSHNILYWEKAGTSS